MQHAAGRVRALERLRPLIPDTAEVVTDALSADPNPWRCFLRCLADPPDTATHLLVVQDDAVPCAGFADAVERAVAAKPDDLLSFFVGGLHNRTRRDFLIALRDGNPWCPVYFRDIHHVVCTAWPVKLAREFLHWADSTRIPGAQPVRSDDMVVGFWARTTKHTMWATVPCLVEHPDDLPSLIRKRMAQRGDKSRMAVSFAADGSSWP